MSIALSLFGAPTITVGGKSGALEFGRRTQLVAYLALKRAWVSRSELAALLWPDQDTKLALTNLRKALFRLQSFPWADQIEVQAGALRFEPATDVLSFETALRERRLADAVDGYRGDLLTGFDDDRNDAWSGWLAFERDRLRAAWRGAAQERLAAEIEATEAIDLAARLLDADPLDETALRSYMSWLAHAGQPKRARQAYGDYVARLAADLGLAPGADLVAFHDSLGTPASALASAPKSAARPNDSFVGRAVELRRIAALLSQDDCRLLCVVGPGGVGKTRLARRVIEELGSAFEDGAVFVPLEDIASTADLAGRLARELGITLKGRGEALEQVIEFLRERRMLLVLDNFEQLATDASILERLLVACPRLRLVVTSRVRLALAAEWLLPLDGLPCPEDEDRDRIEAFDAVRLFVRAAQRVQPALVPAAEASAIVDICNQVEGLPLALELAAAWTRVLSCAAIATELRHGTELLHAADATQPARHASMEVVFDHSWRLLSEVERNALARLSVFRGGFCAEAARAVAGAPLPVLGALADKSLLRKEQSRLYLHPLVQQFAEKRLRDSTSGGEADAAHAAYFHHLLGQLQSATASGDRAALDRIDEEFENCRRAWVWSMNNGRAEVLVSCSKTLLDYWDYRGRFQGGLTLICQAIDGTVARAAPALKALLLSRAAHLEYRLDRYTEAEAHAQEVLATTTRSRDRDARLQALNVLATCAFRFGRWEEARHYFKLRLDSSSPEEHAHSLAVTLDHLALIEKRLGSYAEALRLSLQSLEQHRRLGDSAGEALCLSNLGSLEIEMHETQAAGSHLREGLAICDRDGLVSTRVFILSNLADVAFESGDLAAAEAHANQAMDTAALTGNRLVAVAMRARLASIALRRGNLDVARSGLVESLARAIELPSPPLMLDAVLQFAELLEAQGETSGARSVLEIASEHPATTQQVRSAIRAIQDRLPKATGDAGTKIPGLDFDELVGRIVSEVSLAHAPLMATLGTAPLTATPA